MAYVEATHEAPVGEDDPASGTLVVETDGVMVRYRDRHRDGTLVEGDWHEVKLGLVGGGCEHRRPTWRFPCFRGQSSIAW